jgi:hypothetical protein
MMTLIVLHLLKPMPIVVAIVSKNSTKNQYEQLTDPVNNVSRHGPPKVLRHVLFSVPNRID